MSSIESIEVLNDDNDEQQYDHEVAVGICASSFYDDNNDIDADVTAEYGYPLASAAFITNNQLTDEDFLILSNIEDNDINFGDIIFANAEPIDESIDNVVQQSLNSINGIATTIREALNSIDNENNTITTNNNVFSEDDTSISTKLQHLHDSGYDLSSIEKDFPDKKTSDEKDNIADSIPFTLDTKSCEEKLRAIVESNNSVTVNSVSSDRSEIKEYRARAIKKYKDKKNRRNWGKKLPDRRNRSEAAKKRHRNLFTGRFK